MRVALTGMPTTTILGGTAGLGHALALRLCAAGDSVVIGSRSAEKAETGTIRNARYVEGITALLLNVNARHHARTSIAITGLDGSR
jgi:predicted dinucleotide-binding enzyme